MNNDGKSKLVRGIVLVLLVVGLLASLLLVFGAGEVFLRELSAGNVV